MEQSDEEVGVQESTRGSARQVGWPGPQRGQATRKPGEWAQGRVSQKPPKDARMSAQRGSSSSSSREAVTVAMVLIRGRFGYLAIGMGEAGIRYRCGEGGAGLASIV